MAKRPGQKITMTSIDELLCVPDTEGTIDIDVEAIYPFENHPFKVLDDERMEELTESIRANGILTPVLVRPDDEATIAMVDGNIQREEILPSEKAFALKMKMAALKKQGKRNDLTTSSTEWTKSRAGDIVGEAEGISKSQVHKYIRITELIPKLLDMVDEKRLALAMAVEISYFNKNVQQWLYEYIKENGMIKQEQIMELRQYREDKSMTQEQLIGILVKSRSTTEKRKKIT